VKGVINLINELFDNLKKQIIRNVVKDSIKRELFFDDEELIEFTLKLTGVDREVISRILEAEFLFLKLKGIVVEKS